MKLSCISLAALISQACAYDPIAGYIPGTNVLDHGNIDLDQADMETAIKAKTDEAFAAGQVLYELGGNSKVVASLTVAPLAAVVAKGTVFSGVGLAGTVVTATAYADYTVGSTSIGLKYTPDTCTLSVTDGCFVESGSVTDGTTSLEYTATDNAAKRTLRGFSTAVESKMSDETHANYFKDYFGVYDYADQIVTAALDGTSTSMTNGNVDFTEIGFDGREQVVKKGTAYINVLMYAIHEFESAIGKCVEGAVYNQENAVHAWDEGVAFHVGNLAGNTGAEGGKLVYAVGNKRCKDFGTCGASGVEKTGTAKVNLDLIAMFNRGRDELNSGDCAAAEATKNSIADAMYIPTIQGTLKYAYKGENGGDEKAVAEGTAFAMAVLGRVNAASSTAASTIYNSMTTKAAKISAGEVKSAFESVYADLNLSCEDIGGLLQDDGSYYPGMEPCKTACTDKGKGKKNMFTDAGSGLTMGCGQLNVLPDEMKDLFCESGGASKCPLTCQGFCGCNDNPSKCTVLQSKSQGQQNKSCKKLAIRKKCPDTCKGFCKSTAPFAK